MADPYPLIMFDSDLIAVGTIIAKARDDACVIGDSRAPVREGPDEKWFPEVGRLKTVVIRRDGDILISGSAEQQSWQANGCRGFVVGIENPTVWEELKALVKAWDTMMNHVRDRRSDPWWVAKVLRDGKVKPA